MNRDTPHPKIAMAEKAKRFVVEALVWCCERLHPVTHRNPWLWLMSILHVRNGWCLLATWSDKLDERWGTRVWAECCQVCGTTDYALIDSGDGWKCVNHASPIVFDFTARQTGES